MFRPPRDHPHGGPPRHSAPFPPLYVGVTVGAPYQPSHPGIRGFHPPFPLPYQGFTPLSILPPLANPPPPPPPPPGSPPAEAPPPPPPTEINFRNIAPPSIPRDTEMLKNSEGLSPSTVKNGRPFENLAQAKQAGNPNFALRFGGERGTDAAIGYDFNEWNKKCLDWEERSTRPQPEQDTVSEPNQQGSQGGPGAAQISHEAPASPTGSDMDMEDDFALPPPASERKSTMERKSGFTSPMADRKSGFSSPVGERKGVLSSPTFERSTGFSSPATERKADFSSSSFDRKAAMPLLTSERKQVAPFPQQSTETKEVALSNATDQEYLHQRVSGGLLAQSGMTESQKVESGAQKEKSQQAQEVAASDLPRRRDTRRRTGFDRQCMEDVSPQSSPLRAVLKKQILPVRQGDDLTGLNPNVMAGPANGHSELVTKPSRWGPPESSANTGSRESVLEKDPVPGEAASSARGNKRLDSVSQNRGDNSSKGATDSLDSTAVPPSSIEGENVKDLEKCKLRHSSDPLAVDEFGRILRHGGSDSDGDGHHVGGKKRRRSTSRSRSRSRSPGDLRRKRWSPSRSPRRRGRRSRSWSISPRRHRSRSRTPPREGRWAGDARGDRGDRGFSDRGGRRGGRGGPATCFDFVRGKCSRGTSCRYVHDEGNGPSSEQGGRWGGGRGRGRGRAGREGGDESDRNLGVKSGEDSRMRRTWNANERSMDDDSREKKLIEELKKNEGESSSVESWEQNKIGLSQKKSGLSQAPRADPAQEPASEKPVSQPDSESVIPAISQSIPSQTSKPGPDYMLEALSPSVSLPPQTQSSVSTNPIPQTPHPMSFSNPLIPPPQPNFSSSTTHQLGSSVSPSVSQHLSFTMSPVPLAQHPRYPPNLPHPQPNAFPPTQQTTYPPNVPTSNPGYLLNRPHQQPSFMPSPVVFSGSPSMPTVQPSFPPLPMLRPQSSFNAPQQQNFTSLPMSSGQTNLVSRSQMMNTPPPMMQNSMVQNVQGRPGFSWSPSLVVSTAPPLVPFVLPPFQPPHSQPLQAPPPQLPATPAQSFQYQPLPASFSMTSFTTGPAQIAAPSLAPVNDQYDPLADSLEPGPPGAGDKKAFNRTTQQDHGVRLSAVDQWGRHSVNESTPLMTNAGEVVLENVSPGLPGHMENMRSGVGQMENVSPRQPGQMVMDNVSPRNMGSSFLVKGPASYGGPHRAVAMENVSPAPDGSLAGGVEGHKESTSDSKEQKRKDKDGRVLNLIRKAVAEHVKDLLNPTWKEGQMSKDAFKTIAKKAVDKVMGALEAKGRIPKSQEKLELFMDNSKPKIAKLVKGYVDKYVKA